MRIFALSRRIVLAAALVAGTGSAVLAQEAPPPGDPPGRVGRLSYMDGTVSFHTAGQTQWSPATVNYPVTSGTSFWTEPHSRAEVQVGATEVRMDGTTELDVVRLDDNATQLGVQQGDLNLHVRQMPPGGISIATSRGQVDILAPGSYHIDGGHPNGDTPPDRIQVTVLEGSARFDGPRSSVEIQPGESAQIAGDPISITLVEGNPTPFDDWALAREHREASIQAAQYVPPQMTGYQDLDGYGQWAPTPEYGAVWYPTAVAADWAPYRYGHWAFVPPWGWTWIDDAPWGFAPFHYGRWAMIGGRWGWCPVVPGAVAVRPFYAPALVAFVGGPGFGISLSVGISAGIGWVPLAPFEPFHPWYHTSPGYVRNVNVMNVNRTVINNINVVNNNVTVNSFHNYHAATVVPAAAFTHAAPIQRSTVALPPQQLATTRMAMNLRQYQPTPEARAAVVRPNAAVVERPNAPATIAHGPIPASAQREQRAEPVPRAPGPTVRPNTMERPTGAPGYNRPQNGPAQASIPQEQRTAPTPNATTRQGGAPGPAINPPPGGNTRAYQAPPQSNRTIQGGERVQQQARPQQQVRPQQQARPQQQSRPLAQVQRPQQQTHLTATPQGWKRQPAPAQKKPEEKEKKPNG